MKSELHPPRSPRVLDVTATVCWIVGVFGVMRVERMKQLFTQMVLWCRCESAPAVLWEHTACFSWYWCLFFCSTGELFSQHRCCFCLLWMACLIIYGGGDGSSPASKHVTALYFVFHSQGRVLWQIFWRLINFLFALWSGEGGGRQTNR